MITFTPDEGFSWKTKFGVELRVEYSYPAPAMAVLPTDIIVYTVWAEKHQESEVIPVLLDDKSCGWLFTAGGLVSKFPQNKDDPYFRVAAWATALYLIEANLEKIEASHNIDGAVNWKFDNFLDSDVSIIALYKPMLSAAVIANPNILIPQLLQLGLFPIVGDKTKSITRPPFIASERIKFSSTVPVDNFHGFYIDLLVNHIPYVEMPVFKFYLYYQIIESMMEGVLYGIGKTLLSSVSHSPDNIVNIHDAIDKYKEKTGEKFRIARVFESIKNDYPLLEPLRLACIAFLVAVDPATDVATLSAKPVALSLYRVRNQLIHNYRRAAGGSAYLDEILVILEVLVPFLVCSFEANVNNNDVFDVEDYWFSPS